MIVKDESHVIQDTLEKLCTHITFSYWVICDTGSTDGTQDIIKTFFGKRGIPGELVQHEWRDFGYNRTEALLAAYKKADYIFIFDADDTIHGKLVIPPNLVHDFYKLKFGEGFTYYRPLIVTAHKKTSFVGVLHEFLHLNEGQPTEGMIEGNYYVDSGKTGARSKDKDKYLKDAMILKKAYEKELATGGGLANRYAFYCAQSFKDSNRPDDAIEWYALVADKLNYWVQERYYSCIMLGQLYRTKNDFSRSLEYFLKAQMFDPDRAEGTIFAGELLHQNGHHYLVTLLYEANKNYNKDPQDKLFLYRDFYNDVLEFNCSMSAFMCGRRDLAYECLKKIIINNISNPAIIRTCFHNLRAHAREINEDTDSAALFSALSNYLQIADDTKELCILWNILFAKHRPALTTPLKFKGHENERPTVFLSMTSCKRLDLFKETVNSILNCWTDRDKIDYWFCVDDNSSKFDRSVMKKMYPWFKFYLKTPAEKGHRESMNIIWNKLNELRPKYWIHMEDDFLFYIRRSYVSDSIRFLEKHSDIKQVLFNRGYAETIENVTMRGYLPVSPGFVVHDYKQGNFPYENCHYWPHYSFRPSIVSVDAILELGNYDSPNTFFEMDYAMKWTAKGYKSAFFDMVCCRHTGRLTSERNDKTVKNAYDLNNENQFNKSMSIKVVNLKRRPDRKQATETLLKNAKITDFEFVEAVDGGELKPTPELKKLFDGNDFGNRRGFIGCAMTHYNLWKALLADKSTDYYVIFEDDVTLAPEFRDVYETLKPEFPNHEYLLLGYHMYSANREATKDEYVTFKDKTITAAAMQNDLNVGGTFAYSINKKGAQILVDYIAKNGIKHGIDYVVKICKELKCTELRPQIVFSEWCEVVGNTVDTDIQNNMDGLDFSNIEDIVVDFEFIPGLDHIGDDLYFYEVSLEKLKAICISDPKCAGFNTLGFFKSKIDTSALAKSPYFRSHDGIYIKTIIAPTKVIEDVRTLNTKKVKMICNWSSSKDLVSGLNKFPAPGLELTSRDDADYFIILNLPTCGEEYYDPKKTIVLQMEPWVYDDAKPWGVKVWMTEWVNPDPNKFLHVHTCRKFLNAANWTLGGDIVNLPPKRSIAALVCSDKVQDTGHNLRINFARQFPDLVHVYGKENYHSLPSYIGPVRGEDRYNVYATHKYTLAVENNFEVNYATEKIWEPLVCESLPFYWGCPNLEEYIDPRSFVRLPLDDPVESARIMKQALDEDWWSQRIDAIRSAKKVIMEKYGMFQIVTNAISKHENGKTKAFILTLPTSTQRIPNVKKTQESLNQFGISTEVFYGVNGKDITLSNNILTYNGETKKYDPTVRLNKERMTIGQFGCSWSHIKIYEKLVADEDVDNYLVVEDDAEIIGNLNILRDLPVVFDIIQLGDAECAPYSRTTKVNNSFFNIERNFFNRTSAYIVSKTGAKKLLEYTSGHVNIPADDLLSNTFVKGKIQVFVPESPLIMSPVDTETTTDRTVL